VQAESLLMASKGDKEYLPITGSPEFTKLAAKLAYGAESAPLVENRVCLLSLYTSFIRCSIHLFRLPSLNQYPVLGPFALVVLSSPDTIPTRTANLSIFPNPAGVTTHLSSETLDSRSEGTVTLTKTLLALILKD